MTLFMLDLKFMISPQLHAQQIAFLCFLSVHSLHQQQLIQVNTQHLLSMETAAQQQSVGEKFPHSIQQLLPSH